jgi:hypothetical protein
LHGRMIDLRDVT